MPSKSLFTSHTKAPSEIDSNINRSFEQECLLDTNDALNDGNSTQNLNNDNSS